MATKKIILIVIGLVLAGVGVHVWLTATSAPPVVQMAQSPAPGSANSEPALQGAAQNETSTQATTTVQNQNMKHLITLHTSMGDIEFATYDADAPNTVQNFIMLAEKGFYNNIIFHRIIKGFMVQGGDPTGTGTGGPGYQFADELNPNTASYQAGYKKGVVAMANAGPDTNGSQFFIMLADYPLPNNYTIFGKVVAGQSVVDAMGELPTGPNDRPLNPPVIKSVSVAETQ